MSYDAFAKPQNERYVPAEAGTAVLGCAWRLAILVAMMIALVFFLALLMDLGRAGDLKALPSAVPSAAGFTRDYLKGLTQGDMGVMASGHVSFAGTPIAAELRRALPLSLGLLATALALSALLGLSIGAAAALVRASRFFGAMMFFSVLGISTPSFFAAMLLIWFGVWLYGTTGTHLLPIAGFGWDAHLILPALVLAARPAATVSRLSYNMLVEILDADYIRTATAKGLGPRVVLFRHVSRNAGVPLLTALSVSLRFSLAILPIVEVIFNWPGIGQILLKGIQLQDTHAVVGMTLPLVLVFTMVNLLLEVVYPLLDPRLRDSDVGAA